MLIVLFDAIFSNYQDQSLLALHTRCLILHFLKASFASDRCEDEDRGERRGDKGHFRCAQILDGRRQSRRACAGYDEADDAEG